MAKKAEPYALVEIWKGTVAHSWPCAPRKAAPMSQVSQVHRLNAATFPCFKRCTPICMVALDPSRTSVKKRRTKSTLMSSGVHLELCARRVKYNPNSEENHLTS